jgi:hypothetical protein
VYRRLFGFSREIPEKHPVAVFRIRILGIGWRIDRNKLYRPLRIPFTRHWEPQFEVFLSVDDFWIGVQFKREIHVVDAWVDVFDTQLCGTTGRNAQENRQAGSGNDLPVHY